MMKIYENTVKTVGAAHTRQGAGLPAPSCGGPGGCASWRGGGRSPAVLILSLFLFLLLATAADAVQNFNIRIGVAENQTSGKLLGTGLTLRDAKGATLSVGNGAAVSAAGSAVRVGNKTLALPVKVTAKSGLGWAQTRYRGTLTLIRAGSKFTVVNEVDLENYLRGILKIEMNPEWHQEALKAQAILARTYAVRNRGRFAARGFDLCATQNSQIYRGVNGEDPRTDKAIADTKGQILTYGGKPASIFYHSDSGGATANVSHVWGGSIPYLQGKPEVVEYQSPYSQWHAVVSPADVARILGKIGHNVGAVKNVEVVQRDAAGRAVTLRFTGDRGAVNATAHAFRMAAGSSVLRSTNFSIGEPHLRPGRTAEAVPAKPVEPPKAEQPAAAVKPIESLDDFGRNTDPLIEMTKRDVFTKDELYDMIMNPDKRGDYLQLGLERLRAANATIQQEVQPVLPTKPAPSVQTPAQGAPVVVALPANVPQGQFLFVGAGWGHGVGMSQWGAKAMADRGSKCADILLHYFPGTSIAQ